MKPAMKDIARATAAYFDITMADLLGQGRAQKFSWPRQIAMTMCRCQAQRSTVEVGEYFGKRDHSTALHAQNAVIAYVGNDNETLRAMMVIGAEASWMAAERKRRELDWVQNFHAGRPVQAPEPVAVAVAPVEPKPLPKVHPSPARRLMVLNGRGEFINRCRPALMPTELKAPSEARKMGRRA